MRGPVSPKVNSSVIDQILSIRSHSFSFQNFLSTQSLSEDDVYAILKVSLYMKYCLSRQAIPPLLDRKILASLFFEPSTRTRLSFETAMLRLGGQVISVTDGVSTSLAKGESLKDTGHVVSDYADVMVCRHPQQNAIAQLAEESSVPVINAGDGDREHPTQALLDLVTILLEKQCLGPLRIGFCGDIAHSRTISSLLRLLLPYKNNFVFISQPDYQVSDSQQRMMREAGVSWECTDRLSTHLQDLDVLYMTRLQTERLSEPEKASPVLGLKQADLENAKSSLLILHPLPRVNEIDAAVDQDPRAKYFQQAQNGICTRMALLALVLGAIDLEMIDTSVLKIFLEEGAT